MAWRYIDTDGLVHDDDTRKVWNETTTTPTLVRAYTTEEVAAAEQRASDFAAAQARAAAPAWSATATYAVGDTVTKDGHRWSCLIAHGTERQGTWAPGIAPTIWSDLGPA